MPDWIDLLNYSFLISGFTIALLGLILVLSLHQINKWTRCFFIVFFGMLTFYIGVNASSYISILFWPDYAFWSQLLMFIYSAVSPLLILMLDIYLIKICNENLHKSLLFFLCTSMTVIYLVLLSTTWFTDFIYYFTTDDGYNRGPYYPLLLAPPAVMIVLTLVGIIRRRSKLTPKQFTALLTYVETPLICTVLQMFSHGILLVIIGTSVSALFMFIFLLLDHVERAMNQSEENAMQKASIMKLQMRPHFIFNTMMSIYYLCEQDPAKAQKVTLDFTTYLRKNFTAIANDNTVPFSEELEHTKAYIGVEQVRFEDRINVEYDIGHSEFRIPPLTLQPIVENAIKHGVGNDNESVTINIKTVHSDKQTVLSVTDSGIGFDGTDNNDPHIALDNIKQRLQMMCKGSLTISSAEGNGTVVTVIIPDIS